MATPHAAQEPRIAELVDLVVAHADAILAEWADAARRLLSVPELPDEALLDGMPRILNAIADAIALHGVDGGEVPRDLLEEHALQRLDRGAELTDVIAEFALLRDAILRMWEREVEPGAERAAARALHHAIDHSIRVSVGRFTEAANRAAGALDRLASTTLEIHDLDDFLRRLLLTLLETVPAIDTAAILVREGDRLRVCASVGLAREVDTGFSVAIGEGFAGTIAAQRAPVALRSANDPLVRSPVLRDSGVRALYGVPLAEEGELVGVAYVGSLTAYELAMQDRRILELLAARATSAIRHHALRRDVDRRAAELSSVIESIADGVYIADAHGIKLANRRGLEMLGVDRLDELQGGHPALYERIQARDVATGEPIRGAGSGFARAFRGETTVREVAVVRPDGEERVLRSAVAPIRSDGTIELAVAVTTDVTDAKRYERERTELLAREREARTRVEHAEAAQRFLSEATAILASSLDYEETLERVTRLAVPRLADWCTVDLVDADGGIRNVALVHDDPSAGELARQLVATYPADPAASIGSPHVLRTGRSEMVSDVSDAMLAELARDDAHLELLRALAPRSYIVVPVSAQGRVFGTMTLVSGGSRRRYGPADLETAEHIGRRAGLAIENARLYGDAQQSIRARDQVLAIVSHDLRNPLGAIVIGVSLVLKRAHELGEARLSKHVQSIQRAAMRMEAMISDLLDMASIEAGRFRLERVPERVEPLIAEVVEQHEPLAREKAISITGEVATGSGRVACDRRRMLQVFANLIGNAIKFCGDGASIVVRAVLADAAVRFEVSDTGPGIPPDELPRVFEPYWSGVRHARKGTGLGLFIARGIVAAHDGRMWVESVPGQGTTFSFTLPLLGSG